MIETVSAQTPISPLNDDEISRAFFILNEITSKSGKRKGRLRATSKKRWRSDADASMGDVYYVWRTLAFRLGQDVHLPLHSRRYLKDGPVENEQDLEKMIDYIGFTYFDKEYRNYKGEQQRA